MVSLSLMMGWVSSPLIFCAASKTATNITNVSLFHNTVPLHQLEDATSAHDCWETTQLTIKGAQPLLGPQAVVCKRPLPSSGLMTVATLGHSPSPVQELLQPWGHSPHPAQ